MSEAIDPVATPEAADVDSPATPEPETTSEPDFDAARALDKIRKANAEAKALRDRAKSAEDKLATAEELAKQVPDLQAQLVRERVARKLGLPDALVDRLRGATEAEVMADAEALVTLVAPSQPKRFQGGADAGPKGAPTGPSQLTSADLSRMTPEQIVTAKAEGRLNTLLGIK